MARPSPLCLKAIGWELPHMTGATIGQRLHLHYGDTCILKEPPKRFTLPSPLPRLDPQQLRLLQSDQRGRGERRPKRLHFGPCKRWPYHFYVLKLQPKGLLLPCTTLHRVRLELWLDLYDPLPYPPIFHLRCSAPTIHPLTHHVLWKTHPHWHLAGLWPTCTQTIEDTPCGCGVRVTVRF